MAPRAVTDSTFVQDVLQSDKPVLVDFWAEWCAPCRKIELLLGEIATEMGDTLEIVKLNIDENPEMTRRYGVMSIPTLMLFKDGLEKARLVGARGKEALLREIEPHLAA